MLLLAATFVLISVAIDMIEVDWSGYQDWSSRFPERALIVSGLSNNKKSKQICEKSSNIHEDGLLKYKILSPNDPIVVNALLRHARSCGRTSLVPPLIRRLLSLDPSNPLRLLDVYQHRRIVGFADEELAKQLDNKINSLWLDKPKLRVQMAKSILLCWSCMAILKKQNKQLHQSLLGYSNRR